MMKIGIFYGSSGGNTKSVAERIAMKLGVGESDVRDVSKAVAADLSGYDLLLLGSSTMGSGDLQDDWESFISIVATADLSGKKTALFGCGNSKYHPDTFCGALGVIYNTIKDKTAVVGFTDTKGYTFDTSGSVLNNKFVGLPLDEDNESELTESRIDAWIKLIVNC
ncbi:MAG: flavodoxin [Prevotellaceae bacterium]|jgi:flavodoxin I|nr:flavodoxin [Prevotellaceae bacterium]